MKINDNIRTISQSLSFMHLDSMAIRLESDVESCRQNVPADQLIASSFSVFTSEVKAERAERCLNASHLGGPTFFSDYEPVEGRNLTKVTIDELESLCFMEERRPLVIQGTPGVGKSWLGRAVATRACAECHRTYWITFSDLLEDLRSRKIKDTENGSKKYGKRIRFYSNLFLCIDEFLNSEMSSSDVYILQDLFNSFEVKRKPFLICTQCDLNKLPEMVGNNSLGQSIKGRILGRAKIVSIVGPDIRLMAPDKKPAGTT